MIRAFALDSVLFAVFWKSGIALGAALGANRMLEKRSADLRRLVFSATVVAMFVAGAATPFLPHWTAVTPVWIHVHRPVSAPEVTFSLSSPAAGVAREVTPAVNRPTPLQATRRIDPDAWLSLIWFAVAATLLTRFAINLRQLYRSRIASAEVTAMGLPATVARLRRRIRLYQNDAVRAPVTWGILRPIILVPAGFEALPPGSRDAVIRHEVAHIHSHDFLIRCLTEIACALIWFQPLTWVVRRRLREEQELACDNRVLAGGGKASAYAKLLLAWDARRGMDSLAALGMAHQSCLNRRLYALLDPDLRRDKVAGIAAAVTLFLALAAAIPLAAITFSDGVAGPSAPAPRWPALLAQAHTGPPAAKPSPLQPATQAPARPRFDVVSIKPCNPDLAKPGLATYGGDSSPGRLRISCGILANTDNVGMIQAAYNRYAGGQLNSMKVIPIEGGPDWIHSERYDINARSEGEPSLLMMEGPMMQTILEERFKLKVHRETRQGPVYELVVGKHSPKLKAMQDGSCMPVAIGSPLPLLPEGRRRCRNMVSPRGSVDMEGGTLSMLAGLLGMVLDRPVIDKTGLASNFEIHLVFSSDDSGAPRPITADADVSAALKSSDAPGIFQALQEQLGLRLVPAKGPVDVLVIDHIERPSEN